MSIFKVRTLIILIILAGTTSQIAQTKDSKMDPSSEQDYINILLCRPEGKAVTINILPLKNITVYCEFSRSNDSNVKKTEIKSSPAGVPVIFTIQNLSPDTEYNYRVCYHETASESFISGTIHSFHTQRSTGRSFTFTLEADPHLYDKKGCASLMRICLQNQLNDKPDFMLDLGDTFGDDHNPFDITNDEIRQLHLNFRQFTSAICHSVPFIFCIGNHEGEFGYYLVQTPPDNIAVYATLARKYYFPNPVPDEFYSGNSKAEGYGIGLPENYFAWQWGDALFIVLDAYREFTGNAKPRDWDWTLGKDQYDWFKQTLEKSSAKFKFVFTHHILGQTRGGAAVAKGFEWGGYESNGSQWGFDNNRPGWGLPIHQLMVKYGVNIFFQGHDHLFAKEEVDGIIYQEVPMPSDSTYKIGTTDNGAVYTGIKLDASGHLRVNVSTDSVKVDYVRAWLPKDESAQHKNGETAYSYTVKPRVPSSVPKETIPSRFSLEQNYPNPFNPSTVISFSLPEPSRVTLKIYNSLGQEIKTLEDAYLSAGRHSYEWNASGLESGVYYCRLFTGSEVKTIKALLLK